MNGGLSTLLRGSDARSVGIAWPVADPDRILYSRSPSQKTMVPQSVRPANCAGVVMRVRYISTARTVDAATRKSRGRSFGTRMPSTQISG